MPQLHKMCLKITKLCVCFILTSILCIAAKAQKPLRFTNNQPTQQNTQVQSFNALINNNTYKDKTSLKRSINSFTKDGLFTQKDKHIGYTLRLENKLKEQQNGLISMQISNANGVALYKEDYPFTISKRGVFEKNYVFDANQLQPGFYVCNMKVITEKYADTVNYSFAYEADKVYTPLKAPDNLVSFWQQAQNELSATPANFSVTPRPDIVNKSCDVFEVEFNSTDKANIFGWFTVPKSGKNLPVLYKISDYMGELAPEYRRDMAVLCINTRGTGSSTTNYNYAYTDLGLVGLKDKNKYVLKGIYLDALRGLDVVKQFATKLKLNTNKIVFTGTGLGASASAIVAALNPNLAGIVLDNPSFMDMRTIISFNDGLTSATFPASMFKKFYGNQNNAKESMLNTLDYFDPLFFAPYINCPVLTGFGLKNLSTPAQSVYNFINQLRIAKKEKYICKTCEAGLDKGFYGFKETWLKEKFGQP